jgi:hypothetical protein
MTSLAASESGGVMRSATNVTGGVTGDTMASVADGDDEEVMGQGPEESPEVEMVEEEDDADAGDGGRRVADGVGREGTLDGARGDEGMGVQLSEEPAGDDLALFSEVGAGTGGEEAMMDAAIGEGQGSQDHARPRTPAGESCL